MKSAKASLFLAGLLGAGTLLAGWSDDPEENNPIIVDPDSSMVQPRLAVLDDGGTYVSWFGGEGFNVYLQRLDASGQAMWEEDGVLVADRSLSSTEEYGLDVDADGHAVLVFRDDRFGGTRITANRVSPDGDLDWGSDGVQLTEKGAFVASPRITGASDGSIVAAWFEDEETGLAGLDTDGQVQWTDSISGDVGLAISDLHASDSPGESGQVIAMMATLGGFADPRFLYAQKFDADGDALWGDDPVQIFDTGSLQLGDFPGFRPDGAGGMAVAWYTSDPLQVYAQRINADGDLVFDDGPVEVSTQAGQLRSAPDLAFDPDTQDLFVFWRESDDLQSQFGLYGQYLDAAGQRQWGDTAAELIPLDPDPAADVGQIRATLLDDDPVVIAGTGSATDGRVLEAARLDRDADFVWDDDFVVLTDTGSQLDNTVVARSGAQALVAWQDDRSGEVGIYAQNIDADGNLGGVEPEGPAIDLSAPETQITLVEGQTGSLELVVGNTGSEDLEWSVNTEGDCAPADWVDVQPEEGTVAPDDEATVEVGIESAGLEEGSYPFSVCIDSNDPDQPQAEIELLLEVLEALIFQDRFETVPET